MKNAVVVVGLQYGDEGKGATVDFLTRELSADAIFRFNGGSQCGHNVHYADGSHHCYSQFGSGTVAGWPIPTFYGRHCIGDPVAMLKESDALKQHGRAFYYDARTILTTPYAKMMNNYLEESRGIHGTCGQGIGVTRGYQLKYGDTPQARILENNFWLYEELLCLQRERFLAEMYEKGPNQWTETMKNYDLARHLKEIARYRNDGWRSRHTEELLEDHDTVIFEGAQGMLLDEYYGFHPHTTWSDTTSRLADEMIHNYGFYHQNEEVNAKVIGVIRAYSTRHGAGPFPSFVSKYNDKAGSYKELRDEHNDFNQYQGQMRYGAFDIPFFRYALKVNPQKFDGIVINCMDAGDVGGFAVITEYISSPRQLLLGELDYGTGYSDRLEWLRDFDGLEHRMCTALISKEQLIKTIEQVADCPVVLLGEGKTAADRVKTDAFKSVFNF